MRKKWGNCFGFFNEIKGQLGLFGEGFQLAPRR